MSQTGRLSPGLEFLKVQVNTRRFLVRTLTPDDVGAGYAGWFTDPLAVRFISWRPGLNPVEDLRNYVSEHYARKDSLLLGVFSHEDGHVANLKYEISCIKKNVGVLGVLVGESSWRGKGLFGEVFQATATLLQQVAGVNVIQLKVDRLNASARSAYERAGFRVIAPSHSTGVVMEWDLVKALPQNVL